MSTDVLVVGAGPVGLTMAAELARYGVTVRIVEQAAYPADKSKALFLWSRTLELLDRADCTAAFVAAGQKVDAANVVAHGKQIGRIDFSAVDSPYPYILTLPQAETERLLEAQLHKLGVKIEREVELVSFKDNETGVSSELRQANGRTEPFESQWLIGCDGAQSTVREILGLPFVGETRQGDWIVADVKLAGSGFLPTEFTIFWHDKGVLAIFPIAAGCYRIIADIKKSADAEPADPALEEVQNLVDQRGPHGVVVSDPVWLARFRISDKKLRDYRAGRVFIAGDAAHLHSPVGGQGMNMGMQDAINLAWKLALVSRGICLEKKLLPSYSIERRAVTDRVVSNVSRLTAAAVLKNQPAQRIRNFLGGSLLGLLPARRLMADTLAEVSMGYLHSPLNGQQEPGFPGPGPGERMPPAAGEIPVGAGSKPRFALFAEPSEGISKLLREHADLLEPAIRPPFSPRCIWLVRPDGYVAAVALDLDVRTIGDYLTALVQG